MMFSGDEFYGDEVTSGPATDEFYETSDDLNAELDPEIDRRANGPEFCEPGSTDTVCTGHGWPA